MDTKEKLEKVRDELMLQEETGAVVGFDALSQTWLIMFRALEIAKEKPRSAGAVRVIIMAKKRADDFLRGEK